MTKAKHTPMVVKAAKVLCKRSAEQCNVDFGDSWYVYGNDYLADAQAALDAAFAPELLEALQELESYVCNNISNDYPTGVDTDSPAFRKAYAAIAKATGGAA